MIHYSIHYCSLLGIKNMSVAFNYSSEFKELKFIKNINTDYIPYSLGGGFGIEFDIDAKEFYEYFNIPKFSHYEKLSIINYLINKIKQNKLL